MDEVFFEAVMGEPAGLFLGEGFAVKAVDDGIDFAELSDNIADRELGESAHLGTPWVSREELRSSKTLSGSPFLFSNFLHPTLPISRPLSHSSVSASSRSMKVGGVELRSRSRT
jgi:hypothetical protein